jgi:hypothetical protein
VTDKPGKQPADHKSPAQKEAEGFKTADFEWRGETFTVPATPDDWEWVVTEAFEVGETVRAVMSILNDPEVPEGQYEKFKALKPRNRDAADFVQTMFRDLGIDLPGG